MAVECSPGSCVCLCVGAAGAQHVDEDEDEDVEMLEVEECPKQALGPPAEVMQAWEQKPPPQAAQPR